MKDGVKISIIGAGNVGASAALMCLMKNLGDEIVLLDIVPGVPQGKAMDLNQSASVFGLKGKITGTNDYEDISCSDLIVVTAGFPRKEGMTRFDLLKKNAGIVLDVAENIKKYSPGSFVILTTNPLDVMSCLFFKKSGFSKNKVIGMAGILDTARFIYYLQKAVKVPREVISTVVLGVHGENMVPVEEHTKVNEIPLTKILSHDEIEKVVFSTMQGGAEIIKNLKTSAYVAPAAAVVRMIEAILRDKNEVLPCSVYLGGEYGYKEIFLGVPVRLGKNGVEEIIKLSLSEEIRKRLDKSVEEVKNGIKELEQIIL
ncbi:MAG: malate dehydrogenase [bacterium]